MLPLVPDDFVAPLRLETPLFVLRPLTMDEADQDYDAVMSGVEHLHRCIPPAVFGGVWPTPPSPNATTSPIWAGTRWSSSCGRRSRIPCSAPTRRAAWVACTSFRALLRRRGGSVLLGAGRCAGAGCRALQGRSRVDVDGVGKWPTRSGKGIRLDSRKNELFMQTSF